MVSKAMNAKNLILFTLVCAFAFFLTSYGETGFSLDQELIWQLRLPKVLACLLAGGLLASSGLLMQVFFQNPLAGPDILGISSGASLFVAFWIMASVGFSQYAIELGMGLMSLLGAFLVFALLIFFSRKNSNKVSLIIVGLLISAFASSGISVLISSSPAVQVKNYLMWTMGSFRNVTISDIPTFLTLSIISFIPVLFLTKNLNQLLLSENYARSMGVDIKRMRRILILVVTIQISLVTLYCGPIGFIGVIGPHLARQLQRTSKLNVLIVTVFLVGVLLAFLAESTIVFFPTWSISINSVLGMIGAPIIILYLYRQKEWAL